MKQTTNQSYISRFKNIKTNFPDKNLIKLEIAKILEIPQTFENIY